MGGQTRYFTHATQNFPKQADAATRKWEKNPPHMNFTPERNPPSAWLPNSRAAPHMNFTPERHPLPARLPNGRAAPHKNPTPERNPLPAWSPNGRAAGANTQGPRGRFIPTPLSSTWSTQEKNPAERCQLCLNAGHSAPACRSQSQPCYRCGKPGHFSRACPY